MLTARSQPNPKARQTIEGLRAAGADIVVECGNIAEPDTADRLVSAATATGLPLRGVLHSAAVVEDATLTNITDELIDRDWSPKVFGSWNLHRATLGQPLDWFCLFSSGAALLGSLFFGQHGQRLPRQRQRRAVARCSVLTRARTSRVSARAMACWAASTAVVNASGDNIDTIDSRGGSPTRRHSPC